MILLGSISVNGQETIKREDKSPNGRSTETYYVLKSDMGTKHGEYKRYWDSKLVAEGKYNYGEKEIFNYYFMDKTPSLTYDYSRNEVLAYVGKDNFTEVYSEFGEKTEVDRPPLPLFSRYELTWFIANNLKYPIKAMENGQSGKVQILVKIDANGNVTNYSLFSRVSKLLNEEALRVVNSIPKEWKWLPAVKDNTPIESAILLPVSFVLN